MDPQLVEKLKAVQLLLLDVDGVLTDGTIIYNNEGVETKHFNVKDGLGIRLLMDQGIKVGIVTGRAAPVLRHRCKNLGITLIFEGIQDKAKALDEIRRQTGIPADRIAFIGDDLPDLPIMKRVGVSVAVADADRFVREPALLVTQAGGGNGAVREVCEAILQAKGLWEGILDSYR